MINTPFCRSLDFFDKVKKNSFIKGLVITFLASFHFSHSAHSQSYEPIQNWQYQPIEASFWLSFEELTGKQNSEAAIELAEKQFKQSEGLEQAEAKAAVAILLNRFGATHLASRMALEILEQYPGSMPSARMLVLLDEMARNHQFYEDDMAKVLNQGKFLKVPPTTLSMVSYYVGMDNLKKGFQNWADNAFKQVDPNSYWGLRLSLYNALLKVKNNQLTEAITLLTQLKEISGAFPEFQNKVALQLARLLFETNKMDEAEKVYAKLQHLGRETGRALLERAWIRYHQKDFSITLGMLESLKAPFFQNSISPEQYTLAMLTYKELCYYSSVKKISKEYQKVFDPAFEQIRRNASLAKNQILLKMTLQKAEYQPYGDFVGNLRLEQTNPQPEIKKFGTHLQNYFQKIYERDEKNMMARVEQLVRSNLKNEADYLLKMTEQVKLIEYLSGLDEFRAKSLFENRKYASEEVEHLALDKLYWPSRKEYWSEELSNYKVLIQDRCHSGDNSK